MTTRRSASWRRCGVRAISRRAARRRSTGCSPACRSPGARCSTSAAAPAACLASLGGARRRGCDRLRRRGAGHRRGAAAGAVSGVLGPHPLRARPNPDRCRLQTPPLMRSSPRMRCCMSPTRTRCFAEIFRVLQPGGVFAASNWLIGHDGEPSPDMKAYVAAEGLSFSMASPARYRLAMQRAGFTGIAVDRPQSLVSRGGARRAAAAARAALRKPSPKPSARPMSTRTSAPGRPCRRCLTVASTGPLICADASRAGNSRPMWRSRLRNEDRRRSA